MCGHVIAEEVVEDTAKEGFETSGDDVERDRVVDTEFYSKSELFHRCPIQEPPPTVKLFKVRVDV